MRHLCLMKHELFDQKNISSVLRRYLRKVGLF
jgi:hypothetical protein